MPSNIACLTLVAFAIPAGLGQSQIRPKFEVASIKPCRGDIDPNGRGGGRGGGSLSPGRLTINCATAKSLIQAADVLFADGHVNPWSSVPILEGPAWISSDRYTINAKTEGTPSEEMMNGPMLQGLLEERFSLKIHRETKEIPIYALTVAKGGIKMRPFKEGSCTPIDLDFMFSKFPPPDLPKLPAGQEYCMHRGESKGLNVVVDAQGTSIDQFCKGSLGRLDRPVVDKTGLTGRFDIHLEFAPDDGGPPEVPADQAGPSIFTALQEQLGLKLEPAKGPGQFIVIDHLEKPSEN